MRRIRILTIFMFVVTFGLSAPASTVKAQSVREKAEAEGKLMFYATFNAADSKMLADGF
jgi:hypothetical protein